MNRHLSACVCALSLFSGAAFAIEPIPSKPGWSGIINMGGAYARAESNLIAGVDSVSADLGKPVLSSLDDSPESESDFLPQLNLNIKYTFASQTQLFLGNSVEDILQFDTASVLGVRQQFSDTSILEFSTVSTPFFGAIQVWEDPYVVGTKRRETDRTSRGIRLEYDRILGTGLGVQLTSRKTEQDDERSGLTQLGLSPAEAALLSREGDVKRVAVNYRFQPVGRNIFEVQLSRRTDDLDGKAMSGDMNQFQLTHAYMGERFIVASNLFVWQEDFDAVNPVFSDTREDDSLGLGLVVIDKQLFHSPQWFGQAMLVWVEQDSNIDFYDSSSTMVSFAAQYRF